MVPPGRLELPRPQGQQILSLPRLPVPPQGLSHPKTADYTGRIAAVKPEAVGYAKRAARRTARFLVSARGLTTC